MTQYESGLYAQFAAEFTSEFATTGLFRGAIVTGVAGLSPDTMALRSVGHYDSSVVDFYLLAPNGAAPATKEAFILNGRVHEIKEIEPLEKSLAYCLALERAK